MRLAASLFAAGLFIALSVEAGVRARLFFNDPHVWRENGLFQYKPNLQVGDEPSVKVNNLGFFGADLETPKPPGVRRVILMGSSSLANPELPRRVAQLLNASHADTRWEVNSAGIPRYTSYHNAQLYEQVIAGLEPDVVVVYCGLNDNVYNTNPGLNGPPPVGIWRWDGPPLSVALDMLYYHGIHKRFLVNPAFTEVRSAPLFERHMRTLLDGAQAQDAKVVLVRMAAAYPTDDEALLDIIRAAEGPMAHFWGYLDPALAGLAAHNRILAELAAEYGAEYADPSAALPHTGEIFRDLCHFTPQGVEVFAALIAAQIGAQYEQGDPAL